MTARGSVRAATLAMWVALIAIGGPTVWGHTFEFFYFAGIREVMETMWGRLVILDFAGSLIFLGFWIFLLEKRKPIGLVIGLGILVFGTPGALMYFLVRARKCSSVSELFLGHRAAS